MTMDQTTGTPDRRALMTEMFDSVSYVNDYAGQPLPDVEGEDEDGDPLPPITAAFDTDPINPEFELLHPRGRDGRWITKGGFVKIHPKLGGALLMGTVDDVARDGSINITLVNGRKVNAQPHQIEQAHVVAQLRPSLGESHDPANTGRATNDRRDVAQSPGGSPVGGPTGTSGTSHLQGEDTARFGPHRPEAPRDLATRIQLAREALSSTEPVNGVTLRLPGESDKTGNPRDTAGRIYHALGYTSTPRVATSNELDQLLADDVTNIWHGAPAKSMNDQWREGDYFPGSGYLGQGTYFAMGPGLPIEYTDGAPDSSIVRGAFTPTANVFDIRSFGMDYSDKLASTLEKMKQDLHDAGMTDQEIEKLGNSPALIAALHGYDAINFSDNEDDFQVVMNRGATVISPSDYLPEQYAAIENDQALRPKSSDAYKLVPTTTNEGETAHDAANVPGPTAVLDRPSGAPYLRPPTTDTYDGLRADERARLHGDLQANSGLDAAVAQRVVDQLDTIRQRYGIRVGGVGQVSQAGNKFSQGASAFVTQDGFLAFNPAQVTDEFLSAEDPTNYSATHSIEGLVSHEMTHMLQFGFSDRGAVSWKYAGSAASHHVTQKYFGGDHLAYVKARGEVSGYALQNANGHEAEAEMLATYLHDEHAPPWLVEWGDTVTRIHNSHVDFSDAWGYGPEVGKPTDKFNQHPPDDYNPDDPGVEVKPWADIGNPGYDVPGWVDDWASNLEVHQGKSEPYVLVPREGGEPRKMGLKSASLAHYLESKGYKVRDGWDGRTTSPDHHSGYVQAVIRFEDKPSWDRFIRESGLDVNFYSGSGTYPLQRNPMNSSAMNAMGVELGGDGNPQYAVHYNPWLIGRIPSFMQNNEHGYDPNLPPVPPDVAKELGLTDVPVQKPGELDAVKSQMMGESQREAARGPTVPAASMGPSIHVIGDRNAAAPGIDHSTDGYDIMNGDVVAPIVRDAARAYYQKNNGDKNPALWQHAVWQMFHNEVPLTLKNGETIRVDRKIGPVVSALDARGLETGFSGAIEADDTHRFRNSAMVVFKGRDANNMTALLPGYKVVDNSVSHGPPESIPRGTVVIDRQGPGGFPNGEIVWMNQDDLPEITTLLNTPTGFERSSTPATFPPDSFGDVPVSPDGFHVVKNDRVRVRVRQDQAGTEGPETGQVIEGRVAQTSPLGRGAKTVIEVDPVDGSPRIRAVADQVDHVQGEPAFQGITPGAVQKGDIPRGIPEDIAKASWEDIVNDKVPGWSSEPNPTGGVNPSYWVQNHTNGAEFLVKNGHSSDGYFDPVGMNQNEVYAAEFLNSMNFPGVSPVAINPTDPNVLITQDAGEANGVKLIDTMGSMLFKDGYDADKMTGQDLMNQLKLRNPSDVARMTIMDAVTGNTDRHENNWMIGEYPDGTRSVHPIDHGLLEPYAYGSEKWFQEFRHNASTKITRRLAQIMGPSEFRQLVIDVLEARDKTLTRSPIGIRAGIRSKLSIEAEADKLIAALHNL